MLQNSKMKKLLLMISILMLGACFGGGQSIPEDQFYRLAPVSYQGEKQQAIANIIAVSALESDALHLERAILYSEANSPLKIRRYHYYFWANIPTKLIQDHLLDYLRTTGIAEQVITYGELTKIDGQIGGQIKRFERVIGTNQISVAVELELFYKTRGQKPSLFQHVYSQQLAASDDSMHATSTAFSQALAAIYADFVRDITQK